ncbi:MAG: SDR family NAD(P)-dependent oxidoreductase [Planctomycetota bacterium]
MTVLITGASAGIGRALVQRYLDRGAAVAGVARRAGPLAELEREAAGLPGTLRTYRADVAEPAPMATLFARVERELGPVELVIANAGVADDRRAPSLDPARIGRVVTTNLLGVIHTLAPAIDAMRARGRGHLVAVSSLASIMALPRMSTYGATKAALNHQLEGLHFELAPRGIAVTALQPGFVATDMLSTTGVPARWQMPVDRAVDIMVRAIDRRQRVCAFPRWQSWALRGLAVTPAWLKRPLFEHVFTRLFPTPAPVESCA